MSIEELSISALTLIEAQKTMVLATCRDGRPWTAPVYYVYLRPDYFFFSSPRSRHSRDARDHGPASAAIFRDGDRWQSLNGLQMLGRIQEVRHPATRLKITGSYLAKFPFARELLSAGAGKFLDLRKRVRLYGFTPQEVHYVDNGTEFGRRTLLPALAAEQKGY